MSSLAVPPFADATAAHLAAPGTPVPGNTTTFADNMKVPVHRWYRYSAGYSSEWATSLARHWGSRRVLDPFGGSGTTVLAAQELAVESVGVEVHPMVARIARAKLRWTEDPDELRARVAEVLSAAAVGKPVEVPGSPLVE